jgi:hypothetical protein
MKGLRLALGAGRLYSRVAEKRSSRKLKAYLIHKHQKSNAYLAADNMCHLAYMLWRLHVVRMSNVSVTLVHGRHADEEISRQIVRGRSRRE